MSGTRARAIRALIATTLKGVVLDRRVGTEDRLKFYDHPKRPESAAERTFRVIVAAQPNKGPNNTCDDYQVEFTVELYYALGPAAEDRSADDHERFWPSLLRLQQQAEWIDCTVSPLGVEVTDQNYIPRVSVIVTYRLDSTLL